MGTVDEAEIFKAAKLLVDCRGSKGARAKALKNMSAMLDRKDVNGIAVWRRIVRAIDELARTQPEPGEQVN